MIKKKTKSRWYAKELLNIDLYLDSQSLIAPANFGNNKNRLFSCLNNNDKYIL